MSASRISRSQREGLRREAEAVLRRNDRGGSTIPSPTLYPHIWNWDSAFAAIGWARIDPPRAILELERLLDAIWTDGMVPHIVFNPAAAGYEPGPRWWRTEGVPRARGRLTSSITQPPVAASALLRVLERAREPEIADRARALLPALERWHRWFFAARDPFAERLPAIIHPWESGMDNSPRWDLPLAAVPARESLGFTRADTARVSAAERPRESDYLRYAKLVEENADRGFAPPSPRSWPFLVQDVVLLAILLQSERDLAELAGRLGVEADETRARAEGLQAAIEEKLLDPATGVFRDRDLVSGRLLESSTIAEHLPILAGLGGRRAAEAAAAALAPGGRFDSAVPVPTVPPASASFERRRYWRGPVWVNVNWLLIQGLRRSGLDRAAERLGEETLALVARSGFHEYFDPESGEGLGGSDFTWSAALVLDLLGVEIAD